MYKLNFYLLLLFTVVISTVTYAQETEPVCGFDHLHKQLMKNDPQYRQQVIDNEARIQTAIKEQEARRSNARGAGTTGTLYYIPVVVHVVHTGEPVGSVNNPSDARIIGAINYLNDVFAGTHPSLDPSGAGDIQIQFVLAKRDRNCKPFNGIDRIDFSGNATYVSRGIEGEGVSDRDLKTAVGWDVSSYYNIYLVNRIAGVSGYAQYPTYSANPFDGVVMVANAMDSLKKLLVHEIGHAVNLYHVFEGADFENCLNTDCTNQGDHVCDTDPISFDRSRTCRTGINPCTGASYSKNTESNFMNYTGCYTVFTPGQKSRMLAAMTLPGRASLTSSLALSAPPATTFVEPPLLCPPTGKGGYSMGVMSVSVNNNIIETGTVVDDKGYVNFAAPCSKLNKLIDLQAGGTYNFTVGVYGYYREQVRAWIDYDNDGVFNNETEQLIFTNSSSNRGNRPYPTVSAMFTIPPGAKTGQVLRMRVIDEISTIDDVASANSIKPIPDACFNPTFGQVEDYPVFISPGAASTFVEPPLLCTPPGFKSFHGGIMSVSVNNIVTESGTAYDDRGYVNFAANSSKLIDLQTGGTYNITVAVLGSEEEQVRAWIDYNNDGLFDNATEQIIFKSTDYYHKSPPYPTVSAMFTVPPRAKTGQVLRMRIIDDWSTIYVKQKRIADACFNPNEGQVEDYPVYISPGAVSNFVEPPLLCTPTFIQRPLVEVTGASVNNIQIKSDEFDGWNEEGYVNFAANSSKLIDLQAGGTYNFSVSTNGYYREHVRAWIDYDNDGVFNNATEQIISTTTTTSSNRGKRPYPTVSAMFTIPPAAKTGQALRMRVIDEPGFLSSITDACFSPRFGQVEDYPVSISAPVLPPRMATVATIKTEAAPENMITITNNPFTDKFGITIAAPVPSKVHINLLDVTGKLLHKQSTEVSGNTTISVAPDTRTLVAGMYLVQVTINGKTTTQKIIKQ